MVMLYTIKKKKEEKLLSLYDEKVSVYEFYKALLFLYEERDVRMYDIGNYGHRYKDVFNIDMFRFNFRHTIVSSSATNMWYDARVEISVSDKYDYYPFAKGSSSLRDAPNDEKLAVAKDTTSFRLDKDSPFTEKELVEIIKTFIDEYREKKKQKDLKISKDFQTQLQMRLVNRKLLFDAIRNLNK
jgi:hypothetical protein